MMQSLYYPCKPPLEPWRLYAKRKYNEKVKTDSYEIALQSVPFDNNIRNPKLDLFLPHYNRWGYEKERLWNTTTSDMLNQPFTHTKVANPDKKFISYYTFHDKLDCKHQKYSERDPCPPKFVANLTNDYVTTMQNSYKSPRGYKIERLAVEETPFYSNRRFLVENPKESSNKFWDDNHLQEIELLHKYKPNRQLSYNFMTGVQSDGTELPKDRFTII